MSTPDAREDAMVDAYVARAWGIRPDGIPAESTSFFGVDPGYDQNSSQA